MDTLLESLRFLPARQVRLLFANEVRETLADLEGVAQRVPTGERWIMRTWENLRGVTSILDDILQSLAEVARAAWMTPHAGFGVLNTDRPDPKSCEFRPLMPWILAAERLCDAGRLPLPEGFPKAVHAAHLAYCLAGQHLRVVLACADESPPEGALMSLCRAAQWLAANTAASIAVLAPSSLAANAELDPIRHGAIDLKPTVFEQAGKAATDLPAGDARAAGLPADGRSQLLVWPLHGVPHPRSPGEQLLAARLAESPDLTGLFEHNVLVETNDANRYLVDLLWRVGRLVVEVDGFYWHTSRSVFVSDRQRDFELLVSGYAVLRLPHDEILSHPDQSLDKIRRVVTWQRERLGIGNGGNQ